MDVIENHANACLNEKESPFTCYEEYNCEENECITNDHVIGITNYISPTASQNEIISHVRKAIAEVSCQEDGININIRRNFSFHDFYAHFQKPWKQKMKTHTYRFIFLGEAGVILKD